MIFLSAGHHEDKPGLQYMGLSEFHLSQSIVEDVFKKLDNTCRLPAGTIKQKKRMLDVNSVTLAIEIHLDGKYVMCDSKSMGAARRIGEHLGIDVIEEYEGERKGADFFIQLNKCPSILISPCHISEIKGDDFSEEISRAIRAVL